MSDVHLGTYLFQRIASLGTKHIFGVPGDFNLQLLDYIYKVPGLEWVGTCNELNAAYAADGYARASSKIGVVITTYGVGELSALNGVSGASSENVPVLHIIGQTPRYAQKDHWVLHHSTAPHGLKPNDHTLYMRASEPLCCAYEQLWDPAKIPDQIDRVIDEILRNREPGVLYIPYDLVQSTVSSKNLSKTLNGDVPVHPDTDVVVDAIVDAFHNAKNPAVGVDAFAKRFDLGSQLEDLVSRTGSWAYSTLMGRGTINETLDQFVGIYNGHLSYPGISESLEKDADFVLCVGTHASDFNSGFYSRNIDPKKRIIIHAFYALVYGKKYDNVNFVHVLDRVLQKLPKEHKKPSTPKPKFEVPKPDSQKDLITADQWPFLVSDALQSESSLVIDTGSYQMASVSTALPKNCDYVVQLYYGSIGWALPAAFGVAVAQRLNPKKNQRVTLVEGDGSAQMTIQEISSIVRLQLPVTILLMNNDGYAIERCIWGPEKPYNDINTKWQWTKLFQVFGAEDDAVETYQVRTPQEATDLFKSSEFRNSTKPQLVEVFLRKFDYPTLLKDFVTRSREVNKEALTNFEKAN